MDGQDATGREGTGWDGTRRVFGRTYLRNSPSEPNFYTENYGKVRLPVRLPKPRENYKTLCVDPKLLPKQIF